MKKTVAVLLLLLVVGCGSSLTAAEKEIMSAYEHHEYDDSPLVLFKDKSYTLYMDHQVHEKGTWEIQDGFHTEFDSKSDLREVKHKESHASRQHFADHATRYIGQPEVSPQVLIR